jgi:hypothetical protein
LFGLEVHDVVVPGIVWDEVKHLRLLLSNDGESVIEDRLTVPPSAFDTMPATGYVAPVWSALKIPCPHVLLALIEHVFKGPKMKNFASALPIEEQGTVEHDGDEMLSNMTLPKQGVVVKKLVTSTPPL